MPMKQNGQKLNGEQASRNNCERFQSYRLDSREPLAAWRTRLRRAHDYANFSFLRRARRSWPRAGACAVLLSSRAAIRDERCLCVGNLEDLQRHDPHRPGVGSSCSGHGCLGLQPAQAPRGDAHRSGERIPFLRDRTHRTWFRRRPRLEFLERFFPLALELRFRNARSSRMYARVLRHLSGFRKPSSGTRTFLLQGLGSDEAALASRGSGFAPNLSLHDHWGICSAAHASIFFGRSATAGQQQNPPALANAIFATALSLGCRYRRTWVRNGPTLVRLSPLQEGTRSGCVRRIGQPAVCDVFRLSCLAFRRSYMAATTRHGIRVRQDESPLSIGDCTLAQSRDRAQVQAGSRNTTNSSQYGCSGLPGRNVLPLCPHHHRL